MIKTDTFTIGPLQLDDAKSLNSLMILNARKFQKFFPKTLSQNISEEASKEYILEKNNEMQNNIEFTYAIKENDTNCVAGLIIIKDIDLKKKQGEFAYCIGAKYENKGWMSKAVKETSNYAFNNLGINTIHIIVHKSNIGSVKVAKNCDFYWQKTLLNEYTPPHESPLDMELYELTK